MPKYQEVSELQEDVLDSFLVPKNFDNFLRTAAFLHRYSFDDQVLIHAQRPDVTAVAPIDVWNKNFGRYVVKGSKGIAIIDDDRLRYVFDVSDTAAYRPQEHEVAVSWEFPKKHKEKIFKALEQELGECYVDYDNHAKFVWEIASKIADDARVQTATAITVLERLGYSDEFYFRHVFDRVEDVVEVGIASAKCSRQILDVVRSEVKILAEKENTVYTGIKEVDRHDEIIGVHAGGGLSSPKFIAEHRSAEEVREVGAITPPFLDGVQSSQVHIVEDEIGADTVPQSSGRTGEGVASDHYDPVRETEPTSAARDDGLGAVVEQSDAPSGRSGDETSDTSGVADEEVEIITSPLFFCPDKSSQLSFFEEKAHVKDETEIVSPKPIFIENDSDVNNMDLSVYKDGDVIGYNKQGVKFGVMISSGVRFITTDTAVTPHGEVIGCGEVIPENIRQKIRAANESPYTYESKHSLLFLSYEEFRQRLSGGAILLYRLGDFYEVMGSEAETVAKELGLTLTSRDNGVEKIPMCGFPAHSLDRYAEMLIDSGLEVAVVDGNDDGKRVMRMYGGAEKAGVIEANFRITDDNLGVGGAKTKYRNNIDAIKTLKVLESEGRGATTDEQEVLSKYVGWGGLSQVFDEKKADWVNEYHELKSLLSDDEYRAARASVNNAHYTSPVVIKAMYQALEGMGFRQGSILEPSCGVGNFLGLVPESMDKAKLFGVELDSITGRIAKHLYPDANIQVKGFEDTQFADSYFDVAIGNVPFGSFGVSDPRYNKYSFLIHDYFFAKTLDKVRPGGVVAFITSKGTLDKQNSAVRKYIAQRAELLGAIRLPNNAFKANAGTEVTADIIFLQKRERVMDIEPSWVHVSKTEDGVPLNQYFVDNPQMMLGTMAFDDRMYGNNSETACVPIEGVDLSEQLSEAITHIKGEYKDIEIVEMSDNPIDTLPADPLLRNFSYAVVDGEVYYQIGSIMEKRVLTELLKSV